MQRTQPKEMTEVKIIYYIEGSFQRVFVVLC